MKLITLSNESSRVVEVAQEVASRHRHRQIDASHLFWSLLRFSDIGRDWLNQLGIEDVEKFLSELEADLDQLCVPVVEATEASIAYVQVMRTAQELAHQSGASSVTPDHLLRSVLNIDTQVQAWLRTRDVDARPQSVPIATPLLDQMGRDLTRLAATGKLPAVVGRDNEVNQIIEALLSQGKNSVMILGLPGVGKTAVLEKLAQEIARRTVPRKLWGSRLIELSVSSLVSGTSFRGELEERLDELLRETRQASNVILVIDEFHMLMGAGASRENTLDVANILKPALARGDVTCIGITTQSDFVAYIEKDQALVRRFQKIVIQEPSEQETLDVIRALIPAYSDHHQLAIDESAVVAVVTLAAQYFPSRQFPDKAIDVLRKTCSRAEMQHRRSVTEEDVVSVVSEMSGVPVGRLDIRNQSNLANLERLLQQEVVGQDDAVSLLVRSVRLAYTGLRDPKKPRGVFLFVGPSGVGKTQLARSLARYLMGHEKALVRLDMSEYSEKHAVSRLVGAPPGYIGHGEPGQLTQPLRDRPHSVVLLDEVEKAHPDIFDLFLQLFDEGRLTDSRGQLADARHAIFIMTSNLSPSYGPKRVLGFGESSAQLPDINWEDGLQTFFRPEFINRIDHIIRFRSLGHEEFADIARLEMDMLKERLASQGIRLTFSEPVLEVIASRAEQQTAGARGIKRIVEDVVIAPISEQMFTANRSDRPWLHVEADGPNLSLGWI